MRTGRNRKAAVGIHDDGGRDRASPDCRQRGTHRAGGNNTAVSHRRVIRERTLAGLKAARARGCKGGRKFCAVESPSAAGPDRDGPNRDTSVAELCSELGIRPVTLYRYIGPKGQLREQGEKVLATCRSAATSTPAEHVLDLSVGFRPLQGTDTIRAEIHCKDSA